MFCPKCGREIANDSAFCEYCGARVEQTSPSFNQPRRLSTTQLIIVVASSVVSLIAVLIVFFYRPVSYPAPAPMPVVVDETPDSAYADATEFILDSAGVSTYYLNLRGTAAGSSCELQYDSESGQGEYRQYLDSGETVIRTLRHRYYEGDGLNGELVLDAYDTKGQYVSQFRGTLSNNGTRYSGSITNTRGGSVSFDMRQ